MKYVYTDKSINKSIPDNVPGRFLAGSVLAVIGIVFKIGACTSSGLIDVLTCFLVFLALDLIAFLLIFFAFRTFISIRSVNSRKPEEVILEDEKSVFYTSKCENCSTMIDYQKSDLAFRLWFIKGYVECPCCGKPIRHNKENVYRNRSV